MRKSYIKAKTKRLKKQLQLLSEEIHDFACQIEDHVEKDETTLSGEDCLRMNSVAEEFHNIKSEINEGLENLKTISL